MTHTRKLLVGGFAHGDKIRHKDDKKITGTVLTDLYTGDDGEGMYRVYWDDYQREAIHTQRFIEGNYRKRKR